MAGYTIVHLGDVERNGNWSLLRRALDLDSFGMAHVEIEPGKSIPEHDETERNQEEVFIVLSGSPTMVIDGEDHPAPAGTFVRVDIEPKRTMRNDGDEPCSVLIVSAPRSSGYEALDWN
jgi:mannose-6-phosphate isomerase-like protein (cupin superfamily)